MKILFLFGALGGGGAQRQFGHLIRGLSPKRFECIVCAIGQDEAELTAYMQLHPDLPEQSNLSPEIQDAEFSKYYLYRRIRDVVSSIHFIRRNRFGGTLAATLELRRIIRMEKPDLIFAATPLAAVVGRLALFPDRQTPFCWGMRGIANVEMLKTPQVRFLSLLGNNLCYVPNSFAMQKRLLEFGVSESAIRVICNGIPELPESATVMPKAKHHTPLRLGCVARFSPGKDHKSLLDALAKLPREPQWECILYGSGSCESKLRAQATALGIADRVVFAGWIPDALAILGELDIFVLSSLAEGFSNSIAEAQMHAVPVVTTDASGCAEIVVDGETGFVVPLRDVPAMADRLQQLLDNRELRIKMGEAAFKRSRELFGIPAMIQNYEHFFSVRAGKTGARQSELAGSM